MLGYLYRLLIGTFKSCSHTNWQVQGRLNETGPLIQSCVNCGFTQTLKEQPKPKEYPPECIHVWEKEKEEPLTKPNGGKQTKTGYFFIDRCMTCGTRKSYTMRPS